MTSGAVKKKTVETSQHILLLFFSPGDSSTRIIFSRSVVLNLFSSIPHYSVSQLSTVITCTEREMQPVVRAPPQQREDTNRA